MTRFGSSLVRVRYRFDEATRERLKTVELVVQRSCRERRAERPAAPSPGCRDKLNVYAYAAYVIDCALKRKAPLISLDGGLLEACRRAKVEIIEVKE